MYLSKVYCDKWKHFANFRTLIYTREIYTILKIEKMRLESIAFSFDARVSCGQVIYKRMYIHGHQYRYFYFYFHFFGLQRYDTLWTSQSGRRLKISFYLSDARALPSFLFLFIKRFILFLEFFWNWTEF